VKQSSVLCAYCDKDQEAAEQQDWTQLSDVLAFDNTWKAISRLVQYNTALHGFANWT
jgi:hypothetical protein